MRWLVLGLLNLFKLLRLLPGLPFRALARARRPVEYVAFTLRGDPPWRKLRRRRLFQKRPEPSEIASVHDFRRQLRALSRDPKLKGIVLDVEAGELSTAKRQVMAEALFELRAAGKRVVAHAVTASNVDYELMCAADTVALAPGGRLDLVGFAAEATTIALGLERLGVRAEFLRRGEYKTAPELFTHKSISDIQRQTIETLLDERYGELVRVLADRRGFTPEEARARVDRGPYSARRAKDGRLVDLVISRADLPVWLETGAIPATPVADDDDEVKKSRLAPFEGWARRAAFPHGAFRPVRRKPTVGLVQISGMIVPGEGGGAPLGPAVAGAEGVVRALKEAALDDAPALLLYISSPGGSAVASEVILEQVQRVAAKKPVVAYCDRVAASGGYMAALGAREIWSAPSAVVGSIGVFAGKFDTSGLLGRLGIHRTTIRRGENSAIFSPSHGFTEQERATLDADIEETYQAFLDHVARARKRTREEIHQRGEGRVFSGARARAEGLIDQIGSFDAACARALELAGKRPTDELEVILHSASPAGRFPLLSLLQSLQGVHLYALQWPLLALERPGPVGD